MWGDASADTPSLKNPPQTGQASRRHCQNFLVLCDTVKGYTQSHTDKPDCVRNDYSPAITLTPSRLTSLPYVVAPVQGNRLPEKDGNRTACSCEVHNLYSCA